MKKSKPNQFVPPSVRVMFLPVLYIVILLIVSIFTVRIGIDRIGQQRRELKNVEKVEATLTEKEAELRNSISVNPPLVTPASMALPDSNPALMVISNYKSLVADSAVIIEDFSVSGLASTQKELENIRVSFTLSGNILEVLSLLKQTQNQLPIMAVQQMEISVDEEIANVEVSGKSYFSAYPSKLQPITDPIDKITAEEYQLLVELNQKQTPTFFELSPSAPTFRPSPFSL